MAKRSTLNVSMPPELRRWLEKTAKAESFETTSEFMRHLVRQAREIDRARDQLENALLEAIDSGPAREITTKEWQDMHRDLDRRFGKAQKRRIA